MQHGLEPSRRDSRLMDGALLPGFDDLTQTLVQRLELSLDVCNKRIGLDDWRSHDSPHSIRGPAGITSDLRGTIFYLSRGGGVAVAI